jgi:glutaminase
MHTVLASAVEQLLEDVLGECRGIDDGEVATYIPELAKADPEWFGIAIATLDGHVYEVGDTTEPFTVQSISKPFVYGMAIDTLGVDRVLERVGVEPTGNAFNAILIDEKSGRPFNPMVNAGAIVTTGLVGGESPGHRLEHIIGGLGRYAGRPLDIDTDVYESERATGDRNRAIAYMMRSFGMIDDVETTLDLYFRQCSALVTCRDLAVMAGTLANGGVNPVTLERSAEEHTVEHVLSVMSSCGMYDFSGEWGFTVGLPAKSGVSGGVIAVLPGQLGIGVFAPRLDPQGNSRRGVAACQQIARSQGLHSQRALPPAAPVRHGYRGDAVRSRRVRSDADQQRLAEHGRATVVHELHGDLRFTAAERVERTVRDDLDHVDVVVLDFHRVTSVDRAGAELIAQLAGELARSNRMLLLTRVATETVLRELLADAPGTRFFDDLGAAFEWSEDRLLERGGSESHERVDLGAQELLAGLTPDELQALEAVIERVELERDAVVVHEGAPADAVYFVLSGLVSVELAARDGRERATRVASFGAGLAFGEAALLGEHTRTADVRVERDATLAVLPIEALLAVDQRHPGVHGTILRNVGRVLAARLAAANTQIRTLER